LKGSCRVCQKKVATNESQFVTLGLCDSCAHKVESSAASVAAFINNYDIPLLYLQGDPRQVVTANQRACVQFKKNLANIEGKRGGQVFDCIHSYTEAGCGKDKNCEDCRIKNAIVDTFNTGKSHQAVSTTLDIRMDGQDFPHNIEVSTEKIGNHVLVKIDKFTGLPNQAL
jgi:hypothetical protein